MSRDAARCDLILMYHGLSDGSQPIAADPHYTLPASAFAAQLDALAGEGLRIGSARDLLPQLAALPQSAVMLSFDDGDDSNHRLAWPILAKRGLSADFFVNPARVGRSGFCSWSELAEMAEAGMSIQSHGHTHAYFTHLDRAALSEELRVSKAEIEDRLGRPVSLLAPPGGRSPRGLVALARGFGYSSVLGSVPGAVQSLQGEQPLPRIALTAGHRVEELLRWARGGARALAPLQRRYQRLALAKRMLGDRGYERLRGLALGLLDAVRR